MTTMHTRYLSKTFSSISCRNKTVAMCKKEIANLRKSHMEFSAIAVSGVSGMVIGSIVAHLLKLRLIVVRKGIEGSHAKFEVEGCPVDDFRYIVLDDFIDTGNTYHRIEKAITEQNPNSVCYGIFCYHGFDPGFFNNENLTQVAIPIQEQE